MLESTNFQPRLVCDVSVKNDEISLVRDGVEFALEPEGSSAEELRGFLKALDGSRTVSELQRGLDTAQQKRFGTLLQDLERFRLLDDAGTVTMRTGSQALLELEDLANALMEKSINRNVFWVNVLGDPERCPKSAFYGLAIENYHFLYRESLFDSPVLPYVASAKVRQLMNEFYCEEYGHDEIIIKAIFALGISREDVQDMMPLAETLALCNALSYWASSDPIFFFATLGVLEGKDPEVDLFIEACEKAALPPKFIKPMRDHSDINRKGEHGNLTRLIFAEIPYVDDETMGRLRRQMRLFVEMYDDFYTAIWNFYSPRTGADLVRRMSTI
ncbi:iron-containing redox enzyme family protein [Sorangium sp. So ce296]|uniref:iron-containing redox enzyme family protein n=1 Tax=Sorangium sp. So ce296 TaxID=3133296 RepID=UPI003F620CCD